MAKSNPPDTKAKTGAPSKYNEELGQKLYDLIATTSLGMRAICAQCDVTYKTVKEWIRDSNHPFSALYTRAKELQVDHLAEEILEISDDKTGDLIVGEFGPQSNAAAINRAKLQVDSRKWLLSKLNPKKYGDKLEVDNSGNIGVNLNLSADKIKEISENLHKDV